MVSLLCMLHALWLNGLMNDDDDIYGALDLSFQTYSIEEV